LPFLDSAISRRWVRGTLPGLIRGENVLRKVALGVCFVSSVCSIVHPTHAQVPQTDRVVRLGIICGARCEGTGYDALTEGLARLGWVEGRNLIVDKRGAGGEQDRLPALAAELVALKPDVLIAVAPQPTRAAKDVAGTIPIVMVAVADPVGVGLVQSLARPGGTVTGFTTLVPGGFGSKQLALLTQALPGATRIAVFVNPKNDVAMKTFPTDVPPAAARLGVRLQTIEVSSPVDLERAISDAVRERAEGLLVYGDPMFHTPPGRLPEMAARARLPAIYLVREVTQAGGLMSYGPDFEDMFRRAASYVDRLIKGAKPGDLPIEQPTKFLFVINLKTATALGRTIPPSLLQGADEVIR
jgi:putative ABC transport system substrate-binding protein